MPKDVEPLREQVRAHVARVLSSKTFQDEEACRQFLSYVVKKTLNEKIQDRRGFKGIDVAVDAFHFKLAQKEGVDLVKKTAKRLRLKLASYYQSEGRGESIRICLPTGTYVPKFGWAPPNNDRPVREDLPPLAAIPEEMNTTDATNAFVDLRGFEVSSFARPLRSVIYPIIGLPARVAARFSPPPTSIDVAEELTNLSQPTSEGDKLIVTLTPGMFGYWEAPVIKALETQLASHGCRFLRAYFGESAPLFVHEFQRLLKNLRPDAFVVMPPASGLITASFTRMARELETPIVAIDRKLGRHDFACVEPDHLYGAIRVVEELLTGRPATVICVLGNPKMHSAGLRKRGFDEAIERYQRLVGTRRIQRVPIGERLWGKGEFQGIARLKRLVGKLMPREHVAFFADNPQRGVEVIRLAVNKYGEWPREWRIGWFDGINEGLGSFPLSQLPRGLVGCEVDKEALAHQTADLVWSMISRREHEIKWRGASIPIRPVLQS